MSASFDGFGLRLRCDFPLPGMRPRGADPTPELEIALVNAARLEASWSGTKDGRAWRGELGDGTELTIERGVSGDLRIANADRAAFRLDRAARCLECAPRKPAELAWKRVLMSRVLPLASLAHGYEALHASAVQSRRGVVAIAARSGGGKSTLAAELIARDWPHFTDDVLVLAPGSEGPLAHPGTPHANLRADAPGLDPHSLGEVLEVEGSEAWTAVSAGALRPCPVAAVILLERRSGIRPGLSRMPASPLTLAPYMLGLPDEGAGEARRFSVYSDLAERTPIFRLVAGVETAPAALADAVEGALDGDSAQLAAGVA
jgi:hypothetical protein